MQINNKIWFLALLLIYPVAFYGAPLVEPKKQPEKSQNQAAAIFQFDNPLHQSTLAKPSRAVKKLPDPEIDALIDHMQKAMNQKFGGAGISANQLGHDLQISVVGDPMSFGKNSVNTIYINPVITSSSKAVVCFWHGCLSAIGKKFGKVSTWQEVTVSAIDQKGKPFTKKLDKLDAIVFQHEFRHLLGGGYHEHAVEFKEERELMKMALEGKLKIVDACQSGEKPLLEDYVIGETIEEYSKRMSQKTEMQK